MHNQHTLETTSGEVADNLLVCTVHKIFAVGFCILFAKNVLCTYYLLGWMEGGGGGGGRGYL